MPTIYASFSDPAAAEHAAGALFDHGVAADQLTILVSEGSGYARSFPVERDAEKGITTTTPADAGMGAIKGLVAGSGVGALAALAALFIPGVGLVLGGGALGMALAAGAGTVAAGGAVGGVLGYLRDQGVTSDLATTYTQDLEGGGAILAVASTGTMATAEEVESLLTKYGALNISTQYSDHAGTPEFPVVTGGTVRDPSGVAYESPMEMVEDEVPVAPIQRDVVIDRSPLPGEIVETTSIPAVAAIPVSTPIQPDVYVERTVVGNDIVETANVPAATAIPVVTPIGTTETELIEDDVLVEPVVVRHPMPQAYADRPVNDPLE